MDEKPNRRWSQFRLRTLFVVVAICAAASPLVAPTVAWLDAWWNPPPPTPFTQLVYPGLNRFAVPEEEEPLGAVPPATTP